MVLAGAEPQKMVMAIGVSGRHLGDRGAGCARANVTMRTAVLGMTAISDAAGGRFRMCALAPSAAGVAVTSGVSGSL
jgi:hypothetical protein